MKPPKVERPRLAVVRWRDTHAHDGGWQTVAEVAGSSAERLVVSVGWVLPWGTLRDHLTIAQDCSVMAVPRLKHTRCRPRLMFARPLQTRLAPLPRFGVGVLRATCDGPNRPESQPVASLYRKAPRPFHKPSAFGSVVKWHHNASLAAETCIAVQVIQL